MNGDDQDPRVRQPPPGLTRQERRAWREAEGVRLANLRSADGHPVLASLQLPVAPRQLGRAGRRAWRETERDNRSQRLRAAVAAEAASGESDRYVGALVLMAAVLIIVGLRVLLGGPDDGAPTAPAPASVTSTPRYHGTAPTMPSAAPHTWAGE